MVLFLLLTLIAGFIVCREKLGGAQFFIVVYATAGTFLCLASLEIISGSIEPLKSDELFYIETASSTTLSQLLEMKRALWHLVNYWVLNIDLGFGGLALKLINIPLYVLLVYCIYRVYGKAVMVWSLPIFLPYSLWVATFNLRDVPILLTTTMVVLYYSNDGLRKYYALAPLILLFLLRPFAAIVLAAIIGLIELCLIVRNIFRGYVSRRAMASLLAGGIVVVFVVAVFLEQLTEVAVSYYKWFVFTTGEGRIDHLQRIAESYKSQSMIKDMAIAMIRYAATPIPTSVLERALEGGSDLWGLVDDSIRLIHQTIYYGMLVYLLAHWKAALIAIKSLSKYQVALTLALLSYWPIYSFHLYGVTHQRSKIPLQIVVFLLVVLVRNGLSMRRAYSESASLGAARGLGARYVI